MPNEPVAALLDPADVQILFADLTAMAPDFSSAPGQQAFEILQKLRVD